MNPKLFFLITVVFLHIEENCALFKSYLEKIKSKAKSAYKEKKKGKNLNFWGYDESEYPGLAKHYKEENTIQWQNYYKCLIEHNSTFGVHQTVNPEAILGFEGSRIMLQCKVCLSPSEQQNLDSVIWESGAIGASKIQPIEYTEYIFVHPEDKTLYLFNIKEDQSGQYVCKIGETATAPYYVTIIQLEDNKIKEVHSKYSPVGPYPAQPEKIMGNNLILDTVWGEWSECSKCGQIGRRYKIGYCNIVLGTSQEQKNLSETLILFQIFKNGIPCRSHLIQNISVEEIKNNNRSDEIMTGYCNVKCPEKKIFEVRNKKGDIVETADNSAGIYSLTQGLPPVDTPIERRLQYGIKGKMVVLECPGNANSDAPIKWQIADKNILPEAISKESNGRIYISITNRIHINKAMLSDSNIYSCWQGNELAGTIRLVVEKKFQLNFNHTIMLIGVVLILGILLLIFMRVLATMKYVKH